MSEFTDRVVFITGGASGIGASSARAFAAQGAHVVVGDVQLERAEQVAREVGGLAVPCDVRDDAMIAAAIARTVAKFGALDIAINAAGVGGAEVRTAEYPTDVWDAVIDINLTGVWRCMRHQIPVMLAAGRGTIVNVSSVAGLGGFPRHSAYAASKHGVVGLTRTAALEYGRKGIRINALCPGFTLTPMVQGMLDAGLPESELTARVPLGRLGTAEEMADTVLYLCSSASSFMVGHALAVDGGLSAG
ncbi:SDR family NAD(P)-dependent oxidoreductase [Gemmatimonas groenlandica]|uniref:SDR family oxidoreductase n=1 Tax=Gemmatimonas groenlandica TaxID=2732249 RepID=A0A6M4J0E8_9BACT|nr:SDR family oxidoreductase [Gemmatimonas groenlandica]QJR37941.1 SDR family oxidoreductase [Gemmatimonas groenlandica]